MKKCDVVQQIFTNYSHSLTDYPKREKGLAFAPTNIALCKYWGKRDTELNLPNTSSLSIALPDKGAMTHIMRIDDNQDQVILNNESLPAESGFVKRLSQFLDLFRPKKQWHCQVNIQMNIPVAAGLASSACGFASLVSALKDWCDWPLNSRELSILARLGSGSASRSLWMGFVEWHAGIQSDGMDSYAEPLSFTWPELKIGMVPISRHEKPISSREAMQRTVDSSLLYASWPKKVMQDMITIKQALQTKSFSLLGEAAESNALNMHATMLSAWPPVCYFLPETIAAMHLVWQLRQQGIPVYFTQDAGPNLKLLFLKEAENEIKKAFPTVETVKLFG